MNDVFIREGVNNLTGLTAFNQKPASSVVISLANSGNWVTVFSEPITDDWQKFSAFSVTLTPTNVVGDVTATGFRILSKNTSAAFSTDVSSNPDKIFPYSDSVEILSGADRTLDEKIIIPKGYKTEVQVRATFAGSGAVLTAQLDYISFVKIKEYSH